MGMQPLTHSQKGDETMRRHLGKNVGAGLLSLALLTSLSGCLQTAQAPQTTQSAQTGSSQLANHAIRPYDNRLFSLAGLSWDTSADGKGFYVPQSRFLNYYDPEVGTQVPLCSQSGCRHADESCEAYLANQVTGFVDYNGIWYVMSQESYSVASLWKVDPKAHQRTKVCEFAGKEEGESYQLHSGFISHGYVYLDLTHDTMTADGDIISDNYMVRVQLDSGEAQFLFENQYVKFLGAGEDRVLIAVPTSVSTPMSEEAYLEQNPGGDYYEYLRRCDGTAGVLRRSVQLSGVGQRLHSGLHGCHDGQLGRLDPLCRGGGSVPLRPGHRGAAANRVSGDTAKLLLYRWPHPPSDP